MKFTLHEIQSIIGGKIVGNGNASITGISSVEAAKEGDIIFVRNDSIVPQALTSRAAAVVIHREIPQLKKPHIVLENPLLSFIKLLEIVAQKQYMRPPGIHPTAIISKEALVGEGVSAGAHVIVEDGVTIGNHVVIYPNSFIGRGSRIGDNSVIYTNVSIRENTIIGKRVIIHCNSVIGDDGFGYLQVEKKHVKIPQIGIVEIRDDVEIGAMVTICRAALDKTIIGNGVKIDNHSHIAHNVVIGDNTMLIAYAKIAGSAKIGKDVLIAEDVGITDHASIGDGCKIGGGSNVYKSLEAGSVVWGSPAKPITEEKRIQVLIKKLPELYNTIKRLAQTSRYS